MAWLAGGYSKRKPITITGGASGAQTDFQLDLATVYAAAMQSDFDDLRFTQANGTTLIDAWLASKVDDDSATVVAEFPTTPANTVEQTYYMYYGNAGAASDWDGPATFLSFFDGSTSGWTEVDPNGHISFANNRLEWSGLTRGEDAYVYQSASVNGDLVIEYTFKHTSVPYYGISCLGLATDMLDDYNNVNNAVKSYGSYYDNVNYYSVAGKRVSDVGTNASAINFAINTQYWARTIVDRSGNLVTRIYSDSARTSQVGSDSTVSLSDLSATLQYSMMLAAQNTGGTHAAVAVAGWLDDYTVRKYASGPPTYVFGAEEDETPGLAAPTSIFYGPFVGPLGGAI